MVPGRVNTKKVLDSNAVVNPRTVVVEPIHTLITHIAVSASWGADDLAFWAEAVGFKLLQQGEEVHGLVLFDKAGVPQPGNDPKEHAQHPRRHYHHLHVELQRQSREKYLFNFRKYNAIYDAERNRHS